MPLIDTDSATTSVDTEDGWLVTFLVSRIILHISSRMAYFICCKELHRGPISDPLFDAVKLTFLIHLYCKHQVV